MKKVLFIVAVATLFFSCQREINPSKPSDPDSSKGFSFTAGIEDFASPTRADLGSGNTLVWAKGDQIGIYVNDPDWGDKNQAFNLQGEGGTTTGSFVWNEYDGNFTSELATIAFFPWQGSGDAFNHVYDGIVYFEMPSGYYEYTSGQLLTPLVAPLTYENGGYSPISFKHAGAAVKVVINNLPAGVHSLGLAEVSDQAQNLSGEFSINPANAGTDAIAPVQGNNNAVWLNIEPSSDEREFTFIFPVPELTAPKFAFSMYDENDVLVWQKILKPQPSDLKRGQVLEMPAIDITPYAKLNTISEWGVCGTFNNWEADSPMITDTDGTIHIAKGLAFDAGAEFKIRKNGSWSQGQYGSNNLVANAYSEGATGSDNIKIKTAGTYDLILDTSEHKIKVVASNCAYPDAGSSVTLYFGINTTDYTSIKLCATAIGTEGWPGSELTEYEAIMGKTFYKYVTQASSVWGKTISSVHIYGVAESNWATAASTLSFTGNKDEYYFDVPTKYGEIVPLDGRPTPPAPVDITIDGTMSDWDACQTESLNDSNNYRAFKATYDKDYIYLYTKRVTVDGQRYMYYDFDLDNDSTTGEAENSRLGLEAYMALVIYSGNTIVENPGVDASYPDSSVYSGVICKGSVGTEFTETELSIPRSNLGIKNGDVIKIYSWGNKSADGVASHPITLYIEK